MKHVKRIASLVLALVMVLALSAGVFAAAVNEGRITIDNAITGQTYTIYEILHLESYNKESNAYSYKATAAWKDFVESKDIKDTYLVTNDQGYVTWVENADAAAFAKLAQANAANLSSNQGRTKAISATVVFDNLDLGYYLVDSTLGTLCSLDTTNPDVTIEEKNAVPTNEKEVEEDSTNAYGKTNDADIGQTVNFKSTITAQAGAENYLFHDKMSAGLTFTAVTKVTLNGTDVAAENYEVVTTGLTDDCTFEVRFTQAFCDTLKANDKIVISYTATLNENAVVGVEGNPNESKIEYGQSGKTTTTPPSTTTTYTWDLEVLKYGNGDKGKVLKDAQFVLLNKNKDKVAVVDNGKLTGWENVPAAGEDGTIPWNASTILTTNTQGKIEIDGLDADTYYLREIEAPAGYNGLGQDVEVKITGATKAEDSATLTYTTVVAEINNQSGTELPSTGGMGTTVFYILGSVLVLGAAVVLVTRKRMKEHN